MQSGEATAIDALGPYHLVCPIGSGGFARVWLGIDSRTGRHVAIKRMRRDVSADPAQVRAFADEAALGLRLQHPNIVETIEHGRAHDALGTEHYLVLELLLGRNVRDLVNAAADQRRPVPLGVALTIIRDVARGLHHAHQLADSDGTASGVVHRDVNPRNAFVCASGATKLIDFGIAKGNHRSHATAHGVITGTIGYLAPEQILGRSTDARVDVFALGLIAYELLTGAQPMRGDNDADTLFRLLEHHVPSPETVRRYRPPSAPS